VRTVRNGSAFAPMPANASQPKITSLKLPALHTAISAFRTRA
jgi:hypothetical protein